MRFILFETNISLTFYSKPKTLIQNQLLLPCLQVAFAWCTESSEGNEEEEYDEEDGMYLPAYQFGAQMVDNFALTISAKKVQSRARHDHHSRVNSSSNNIRYFHHA